MIYFIAGFLTAVCVVILEIVLILLRKPLLVDRLEKISRGVVKPQGTVLSPEKTTLEQVKENFKSSNDFYDESM
jgi:hypothetical protein